jgi:hypothetical protein
MARNANDAHPNVKVADPEADEVDSMLNALEVSPPVRRRGPEITPAPEAIAKAKGGGKRNHIAARTMPMTGAPQLPREAINAKLSSNPGEQAFLNKTEESPPPRRRNDKTMMTGMRSPKAPASSGYLMSAGIAFVAVLAVGLIGWRVMKYIESQAPAARDPQADVRPAGNGAAGVGAVLGVVPSAKAAVTQGTVAVQPATTVAPQVPGTAAAPVAAANTAVEPVSTQAPASTGRAPGKPQAGSGASAAPAGSGPGSKYGGMVSPELQ